MNWKRIHRHLSESGFTVYAPGQHEGICKNPYLVLRNNGTMQRQSMECVEYEVLMYYPIDRYSEFEDYIESVKGVMNGLFPALKLVDDAQPHYPDNDKKAYMTGLIYRNSKGSKVNRI